MSDGDKGLTGKFICGVPEKDVHALYEDQQDIEHVKALLKAAERDTSQKVIPQNHRRGGFGKWLSRLRLMATYGFHPSKPLHFIRTIRNLVLGRVLILLNSDRHILKGCEFDITFGCNFSCRHCSVARLKASDTGKELLPSEYRRIVDEAMRLGATSFGLEGGEPFVRKDWAEIVEACRAHENHMIISTNGFLLDEKNVKKCSELGVDTINLSLDNGIPELHDLFRNKKGSYDRVMRAISLCKTYRIKVILNTVVHKYNLYTEGLRKVLELGEREKILVHLLFAKAIGNFKGTADMLEEDDITAFRKIIEPYTCAFVHHDTRFACGGRGCNGTKEMLQFTPYGDVMHCANMHIYFGNIREESLGSIRERALHETPFGKYRPCFLTMDENFMEIYYSLLENKSHANIDEFRAALTEYEKVHHHVLYPEIYT